MEKENFDEELKSRIKQVFNDYEDGTADEGWNRLREKYPEKKHHKYFFWWFGLAAALFLAALLFGLFQSKDLKNNRSKMVKQPRKNTISTSRQTASVHKNYASVQNSSSKKPLPDSVITPSANTKKAPVKTVSPLIAKRLQPQQRNTERAAVKSANIEKVPVKTVSSLLAQTVTDQPQKAEQPETKQQNQLKTATPNNTVFTNIKKVSAADSIAKAAQVRLVNLSDSSQKKQQQIIAKTANPVIKPAITKKAVPAKKLSDKPSKFSFGLFAGMHFNYATGSNNQLGLGTGLSLDFRIGKNLKLVSGLGLMQNNLSYSQGVPASSQLAATSYAAAAPQTVPVNTSARTSNLKSMDASLLALDIPVNLTYTFLPGKNSISVSAGISSTTFAREVYDYHYNVFTAAATSTVTSTQNQQDRKSFSNFNFAKTLNLAAGFAYPLGKNKLQIEPFLKYPLGGTGSQQLFFGSVGINLKLNFPAQKK